MTTQETEDLNPRATIHADTLNDWRQQLDYILFLVKEVQTHTVIHGVGWDHAEIARKKIESLRDEVNSAHSRCF